MEEQLISFEVAKLAKEKEFPQLNYPCYADDEKIHTSMYFLISYSDFNKYYQSTQSLLQKWLREKYDIDIIIYRSFSMKNSYHYGIIINCNFENEIIEECIPDIKYEEALEEGLLESLKLI